MKNSQINKCVFFFIQIYFILIICVLMSCGDDSTCKYDNKFQTLFKYILKSNILMLRSSYELFLLSAEN